MFKAIPTLMALALLSACGGAAARGGASSPPAAGSTPTAVAASPSADPLSPSPAPAGFPIGTYTVTLDSEQASEIPILIATTSLRFSADGTYLVDDPNEGPVAGVYFVDGTEITIRETGSSICGSLGGGEDRHGTGRYTWALSAGHMVFKAIFDACDNGIRARLFTTVPWSKTG